MAVSRRWAVWGLTLFVGLGGSVIARLAPAADEPPQGKPIPVEVLFKRPAYAGAVLSPNGRYLAVLGPVKGRRNLSVVDLESRAAKVLTSYETRDVEAIFWASNDRLLYTTGDQQGLEFRGDGGLFAIDRDAKNPRTLVEPLYTSNSFRFVYRVTSVLGRLKGNSDEVLVSANDRSEDSQDVYRMNVMTGRKSLLSLQSPGHVLKWVLDRDNEPRAALSHDEDKKRWWFSYRSAPDQPWAIAAQWDENLVGVTVPLAFDPLDATKMYVASNTGRDTMALFGFDMPSGKLGKLLYADDRYDISSFYLIGAPLGEGGRLVFGGSDEAPAKLIGIRYNADKPKTVWFDEKAARAQATVDAALPDTLNRFDVNQPRAIVFASSDTNPGEYFIFDQATRTLEDTGLKARPWIKPKTMAPMRYVTWTARDGMKIGGYLTLPLNFKAGAAPPPLILHPHGGPWAKDNWGFDREVQFMANRGFAVLQPNFRGSTGYGAQHLRSSYRQFGGTMMDDMIDGVDWAIKQGFADADRVGVYGASYGGYAALMALVRWPEKFKWGINYVGVTDLEISQDTQPAQLFGKFGPLAKVIIGDKRADKAMFETQSPARHVDRIAVPVFHAYGGEDRNVDYANGRAIRAAFESAGKPYEWMFDAKEAHGFRQPKTVVDFYTRFDKFIGANTPAPK